MGQKGRSSTEGLFGDVVFSATLGTAAFSAVN